MPNERLKILVLSDFHSSVANANVIRDFLFSFNRYSRHDFYYLSAWRRSLSPAMRRLRQLDLNGFDAIVLFWDYWWRGSLTPSSNYYIPDDLAERIATSRALKVQFLQDEYRQIWKNNEASRRLGVNVIFTCAAPTDHSAFYPTERIPTLEATYTVLTGYVPRYLECQPPLTAASRPIDVGYRSRRLPYHLGSLAQEKTGIAEQFLDIAARYRLSADISVEEDDRLYGERWLNFLRRCRCSLGTESGASVVDMTGAIENRCTMYLRRYPVASFAEVRDRFFPDEDGRLVIKTISPRVFEAAALGSTLVLHEGEYAELLQPGVHYIPVKKDYSNVEEVVAQMRDTAACARFAHQAYTDLIRSRRYSYESFVRYFDKMLQRHVPIPRRQASIGRTGFHLKNYCHGDTVLPYSDNFLNLPHWKNLLQHLGGFSASISRYPLIRFSAETGLGRLLQGAGLMKSLVRDRMLRGFVRAALGVWWRTGRFEYDQIVRDAVNLKLLLTLAASARAGHFTMGWHNDPLSGRLTLTIRPAQSNPASSPPQPTLRRELGHLLRGQELRHIVWDHRAVDTHVHVCRRGWGLSYPVGARGEYSFRVLPRLDVSHSELVIDLLQAICPHVELTSTDATLWQPTEGLGGMKSVSVP